MKKEGERKGKGRKVVYPYLDRKEGRIFLFRQRDDRISLFRQEGR